MGRREYENVVDVIDMFYICNWDYMNHMIKEDL